MSTNKFQASAILLLFLFVSLSACGKDQLKFQRLSLEKGAALNLTYCMLQDHKGFIWFGTMYGLVKYDGKEFKIYKNNPDDLNSISFDDIISLYEDSKYNIWIGTWGGGLNKFNPETEEFTRFINDDSGKEEISGNIIWAICEDDNGNMWFGTETGGVDKFDSKSGSFKFYIHYENNPKSISSNSIRCIYKDNQGILWIGNQMGLSIYNKSTDDFTNYSIYKKPKERPIPVSSIYKDDKNNLLIGTPIGLFSFDNNTRKFSKTEIAVLQNKFIYSFCKGRNDILWVGTNLGLFSINSNDGNLKNYVSEEGNPFSLSGNNILNLMTDQSGILWINSYGKGINKLNSQVSQFTSYSYEPENNNSLSNNLVNAVCITKNNDMWIGTFDGLNKFDKQTGNFKRFYSEEPLANRIKTLLPDNDLIWIGTARGIKLFSSFSNRFEPLPGSLNKDKLLNYFSINSLMKNSDGNIFIGTYGNGMFIFNPGKNSLNQFKSGDYKYGDNHANYILCLYQDNLHPDITWIGTYAGLIKMDTEKKSFKVYKHILNDNKSLSNDYVFSVIRDSHKTLWIGTANGLNKFDEISEVFVHYFEKDGLPNSVISSIIGDDKGNLWISTNYGISEFNPVNNQFKNYDMNDGLRNNLFFNHSSLKDDEGNIYFGGTNGFDVVHPSLIQKENFKPGVYITSIKKINGEGKQTYLFPINENIKLNYYENFIGLNFISLDYNNPSKNFYKYKLEGIDKDWIEARNVTTANYTNLPPGEYVFHVKGSNSNGVFNPDEAALNITILPPFWKTMWFNLSIIMIIIFAFYIFYRIKVRQKINRTLELERIREEESDRLRKKTAADFHDELGHRLTRISLLSEILKRKIGTSSGELTGLLNKISINSNELYEGTKDFIWAIDPQKDSLYELMIRLKDFGDDLFEDSDILFEVNGIEEPLLKDRTLTIDWKRHLALIFKEAMNNSLKHGRGNRISINPKINSDDIEIILSDNGVGFKPGVNVQGNGLKNMKKRAEKLSAKLDIVSSPGNGTQIFFKGKIPVKDMHYN